MSFHDLYSFSAVTGVLNLGRWAVWGRWHLFGKKRNVYRGLAGKFRARG
jgi:hypothetical protein